MFLHTTRVHVQPGHRLHLTFNNGVSGEVILADQLWGEMFEPLKDEAVFSTARQSDDLGTVVWENGADFAPEFLMDLLIAQQPAAA